MPFCSVRTNSIDFLKLKHRTYSLPTIYVYYNNDNNVNEFTDKYMTSHNFQDGNIEETEVSEEPVLLKIYWFSSIVRSCGICIEVST